MAPALRRAAALLAVVALGSACSSEAPVVAPPTADGTVPAGEACGDVVTPTLQEGSHLIGDTEPPVPYSSNPPTSGWHKSGAVRLGVQTEALTGPELVSALEAGNVVLAYQPGELADDDVARLEALATGALVDRVTVTPWGDMATPIALVGWGALQRCTAVDEATITTFSLSYVGAAHHG